MIIRKGTGFYSHYEIFSKYFVGPNIFCGITFITQKRSRSRKDVCHSAAPSALTSVPMSAQKPGCQLCFCALLAHSRTPASPASVPGAGGRKPPSRPSTCSVRCSAPCRALPLEAACVSYARHTPGVPQGVIRQACPGVL